MTRHFLCCEHLEQILDRSKTCLLDYCKHILRYLKGTIDYGLKYNANQKIGYVDLDLAESVIDRKSTSGCCFSMGLGVIS